MQNIQLASGDSMPVLGLGTWKMNDGIAFDAVKTAIENGYRHIDCAWIYENESDVGRAFTQCVTDGTVTREELWVTSKLWNDRHRKENVIEGLRESLTNLQLDYLDLYLIHWPVAHQPGIVRPQTADDYLSLDDVPLVETWSEMLSCVRQGLCRNVGVANFSEHKIQILIDGTGSAPACNQVESHPYLQQNDLLEFCKANEIAFTAYSPLGSGDRPEAMKSANEPSLFDDPTLQVIAKEKDVTIAQIMLAWAVNRGSIPIPKSSDPERQRQNLAAAEIELSGEDMQAISGLDRHHRFVDGLFWETPGGPYTVDSLWDEAAGG